MDKLRKKSPKHIQQWVDSLPVPEEHLQKTAVEQNHLNTLNVAGPVKSTVPTTSRMEDVRGILSRDASFQSDDASSHCSSVESVLELRRPDPEAVLIGLGFGPSEEDDDAHRIPKRFLQPSKLPGVDFSRFLHHRESKEAATNYYYPYMTQSSLNIGQDCKNIPLRKDSTSFDHSS